MTLYLRNSRLFLRRSSLLRTSFLSTAAPQLPRTAQERVIQLVNEYKLRDSVNKSGATMRRGITNLERWVTENDRLINPIHFNMLVHVCCTSGDSKDVDIVLDYAREHGQQLGENVPNSILAGCAGSGNVDKAKQMYRKMVESGTKVRLKSLMSLLEMATGQGDLKFAIEVLQFLSEKKLMPKNLSSIQRLIDVCVGVVGDGVEAVTAALQYLKTTNVLVDMATANSFQNWAKSLPGVSCTTTNTTVSTDGTCQSCGLQLEKEDLNEAEHQVLLECVDQLLKMEANCMRDNRRELERQKQLKQMLSYRPMEFGSVVDGMNAAHFHFKIPSRQQLLSVSMEMKKLTGKPVLVLCREHITKVFTTTDNYDGAMNEIRNAYLKQGLYFFFTRNRVFDDLYVLYSALALGLDTFIYSNDKQGDVFASLAEYHPDSQHYFKRWLRTRQVLHLPGGSSLKFPRLYADLVQWTDSNWHLPLEDGSWLCVQRLHTSQSVDH